MSRPESPEARLAAVRRTLEELADALGAADLDRLLACEARLETGLTGVSLGSLASLPADVLAAELERTGAALVRCRRLGGSLDAFVTLTLGVAGFEPQYGRPAPASAPLHTISRSA